MKEIWNRLAEENGLRGFYFFGFVQGEHRLNAAYNCKYDAVVYEHMPTVFNSLNVMSTFNRLKRHYFKKPVTLPYSKYIEEATKYFKEHTNLVPCMLPNFDHSPRSAQNGIIMTGDNPERWYEFCTEVRKLREKSSDEEKFVFIKAWNEWGEGNYMEPDQRFGKGIIEATRKAFFE
jgi:hypothetical protein